MKKETRKHQKHTKGKKSKKQRQKTTDNNPQTIKRL